MIKQDQLLLEQAYDQILTEAIITSAIKGLLQTLQSSFKKTYSQLEEEDAEKAEALKQAIQNKDTAFLSNMIKDLSIGSKLSQLVGLQPNNNSAINSIKTTWSFFTKACSAINNGLSMSHKYGSVVWTLINLSLIFVGFYLMLPRPDSFALIIKTINNPSTLGEALSDTGFIGAVMFSEGALLSFLFGLANNPNKK